MFEKTKHSKEEIKELLQRKRELIKNNPDYYWNWPVSKNKDYIWYKNFISN